MTRSWLRSTLVDAPRARAVELKLSSRKAPVTKDRWAAWLRVVAPAATRRSRPGRWSSSPACATDPRQRGSSRACVLDFGCGNSLVVRRARAGGGPSRLRGHLGAAPRRVPVDRRRARAAGSVRVRVVRGRRPRRGPGSLGRRRDDAFSPDLRRRARARVAEFSRVLRPGGRICSRADDSFGLEPRHRSSSRSTSELHESARSSRASSARRSRRTTRC